MMLGNMHHLENENSHVWILTGTGNKLRYVDVTKIYEQLGASLCRSLPGFHAFTGCNYNPVFLRKGNKGHLIQVCKKKIKNTKTYNVHAEQDVFNTIQKFTCNIYNMAGIIDVDAARLH